MVPIQPKKGGKMLKIVWKKGFLEFMYRFIISHYLIKIINQVNVDRKHM